MKKETFLKTLKNAAFLATTATLLASCGGGGGNGGGNGGGSTAGYYRSAYVTANQFVNALNNVDGSYYNEMEKLDTIRGEGFFVYFDDEWQEYVAVDVDYLRTIQYWSYYANTTDLAGEYRDIQDDDYFYGGLIGDGYGDDYEIVDYYDYDVWNDEVIFQGIDSGYLYEDEEQTVDTGVMAANEEDKKLYQQASKYSVVFKIPAKEALSLVTMEKEVKRMLADAQNGELLEADKQAFAKNIEHFTGKTIAEFEAAKEDPALAQELREDIAAKLGNPGTTAALEDLLGLDAQL